MRRREKGTVSHHYSGPDFGFPRGDARLDFTDLYAFPNPSNATKSILVMNVHPSAVVNPPGPTTAEPFAPEALYEFKIDTNDDVVADIAYRVRFSVSQDGSQTATLCRVEGEQAPGAQPLRPVADSTRLRQLEACLEELASDLAAILDDRYPARHAHATEMRR